MNTKTKEALVDKFINTIGKDRASELYEAIELRYKRELTSIFFHIDAHFMRLTDGKRYLTAETKALKVFLDKLINEISSEKDFILRDELLNGFDHLEDLMLVATDRVNLKNRLLKATAINTTTVGLSTGALLTTMPLVISATIATFLCSAGIIVGARKLAGRRETLKTSMRFISRTSVTASQRNYSGETSYIIDGSTTSILDRNMQFKQEKNILDPKLFAQACAFNKSLASWDITKVTDLTGMFSENSLSDKELQKATIASKGDIQPYEEISYSYHTRIMHIDNIARNTLSTSNNGRSENFDLLLTTEVPVVRKLRVEYLLRVIPVNGLIGNFINKILNDEVLDSVGIPKTGVIRDYEFTRTLLSPDYQAKRYF